MTSVEEMPPETEKKKHFNKEVNDWYFSVLRTDKWWMINDTGVAVTVTHCGHCLKLQGAH